VHPWAGHFFRALCAGKTRTLITTRLMPVPLEGLAGVKRVCLTGLSRNDTVRFLRGQGVRGTRSEMEDAEGVSPLFSRKYLPRLAVFLPLIEGWHDGINRDGG